MVGGRGCVEKSGGDYLVTVAWQGMTPDLGAACVGGLRRKQLQLGSTACVNDLCRRTVTTLVRIATLNSYEPSTAHLTTGAAPHSRQPGFTLVELMISMVIGLFIVLALLTLLINVNRNNSELTKTNRVIENGRFALQLLETDVSHAVSGAATCRSSTILRSPPLPTGRAGRGAGSLPAA